jgi:hypothetical protein
MNQTKPNFALDANVFIQAHRRYYGFDICPGFWTCLLHHARAERLCSIDRVRKELLAGGKEDALESWVKSGSIPKTFFASTSSQDVAEHFTSIMQWVHESDFKNEAREEFARVADGWLVAYAAAHRCTVVTLEEFNPKNKKKVLIPNVCRQFRVDCINTFQMLRALETQLDWKAA